MNEVVVLHGRVLTQFMAYLTCELHFLSGTRETIDLTKRMAAAGADAALVVTPCFFKNRMNAKAMNKHYTAVSYFSTYL